MIYYISTEKYKLKKIKKKLTKNWKIIFLFKLKIFKVNNMILICLLKNDYYLYYYKYYMVFCFILQYFVDFLIFKILSVNILM